MHGTLGLGYLLVCSRRYAKSSPQTLQKYKDDYRQKVCRHAAIQLTGDWTKSSKWWDQARSRLKSQLVQVWKACKAEKPSSARLESHHSVIQTHAYVKSFQNASGAQGSHLFMQGNQRQIIPSKLNKVVNSRSKSIKINTEKIGIEPVDEFWETHPVQIKIHARLMQGSPWYEKFRSESGGLPKNHRRSPPAPQ